jgi:hypothetical protein
LLETGLWGKEWKLNEANVYKTLMLWLKTFQTKATSKWLQVQTIINEYNAKDHPVSCIIVEPVQSEGGDNHASPEFFRGLQKICKSLGMAFIIDEVSEKTFYRTIDRIFVGNSNKNKRTMSTQPRCKLAVEQQANSGDTTTGIWNHHPTLSHSQRRWSVVDTTIRVNGRLTWYWMKYKIQINK